MRNALITILDSVGETSMPYNEFVRWRAIHCMDEDPILILIGSNKDTSTIFPQRLKIIRVGRNPFLIRKKINSLLKKLKKDGVGYCIHLHQLKSATLAQLSMIGTGFRKKTIFTIHSTFTGYALHNKVQSYFNGLMARYVSCVSEASYANYPSSLLLLKRDRVLAIRNGVDIDRIDSVLADFHKKNPKNFVQFIYVARIIPLKNHPFLIEAIKGTDPRAHFLFVGQEGDGSIIKTINEAGLQERIKLTGLIPRDEVFVLLSQSDVYVSTSTLEGMPISVLEAMYCNLPVILSEIPQHKEIGGNNRYVTYLPFEADKWTEEINKYTMMSIEDREQRGKESKCFVKENFSLYTMHNNYSRIYKILQQC